METDVLCSVLRWYHSPQIIFWGNSANFRCRRQSRVWDDGFIGTLLQLLWWMFLFGYVNTGIIGHRGWIVFGLTILTPEPRVWTSILATLIHNSSSYSRMWFCSRDEEVNLWMSFKYSKVSWVITTISPIEFIVFPIANCGYSIG